ncbi:hypothetical protein Bca4012_099786 [Brassica carinata]
MRRCGGGYGSVALSLVSCSIASLANGGGAYLCLRSWLVVGSVDQSPEALSTGFFGLARVSSKETPKPNSLSLSLRESLSSIDNDDNDEHRSNFTGKPNSVVDLIKMSNELLDIDPIDLQFPFELKKQISSSLYLANKTDDYVAFKVKTTNPKKYCVRPNTGVVLPRSSSEVLVTMQAQKEAPADMQCKDKFLLQCVVASPGATAKEVTPEMFSKEAGHRVEETKLRVVYVDPPQPPSPVREGSEEGSSPRASVSDSANVSDFTTAPRFRVDRLEPQENSSERNMVSSAVVLAFYHSVYESATILLATDWQIRTARALITRLTEEKNSALQLNKKLQEELEQLKRESKRSQSGGGIPFMYVLLVGLIGLILGYIMTRT